MLIQSVGLAVFGNDRKCRSIFEQLFPIPEVSGRGMAKRATRRDLSEYGTDETGGFKCSFAMKTPKAFHEHKYSEEVS